MDIETINNIREVRDEIRAKIKTIDYSEFRTLTYGQENEYTFKGIIGCIEFLLIDISTLTKAPSKFVAISTFDERHSIHSNLSRINDDLETPEDYISQFEELKILIRSYNGRNISDWNIEFEAEISAILKLKLDLQEHISEIQKIKDSVIKNSEEVASKLQTNNEKFEEIEEELEKIIEKKNDLIKHSEKLETFNEEIEATKDKANENLNEIMQSMTESKSNEKLINSFAAKVQERDKRLGELEQATKENNDKLQDYEAERIKILEESNSLIDSAKKALNYKTAEGISASFQGQYDDSNNPYVFGGWLVGAVLCLIGTIGLGIWILHNNTSNIGLLIGRISLLPLPIIGAIFCANQFTKQKNIIEDYAYKMVLSKSIVGFSEQLKKHGSENNEEYVHYIKTALEEIHRDPLRSRSRPNTKSTDSININLLNTLIEKINNMTR